MIGFSFARWLRAARIWLMAGCTVGAAFLAADDYARAATFTVTSTADSGPGSLRAAMEQANANGPGADTITITATGTITLANVLPMIEGDVTIAGPGAADLTISGNNAVRPFFVRSGTVTIADLTIANGRAKGGDGGTGAGGGLGAGGAIFVNENAHVTIDGVAFSANAVVGGNAGAGTYFETGGGGGGMGGNGGSVAHTTGIADSAGSAGGGPGNHGVDEADGGGAGGGGNGGDGGNNIGTGGAGGGGAGLLPSTGFSGGGGAGGPFGNTPGQAGGDNSGGGGGGSFNGAGQAGAGGAGGFGGGGGGGGSGTGGAGGAGGFGGGGGGAIDFGASAGAGGFGGGGGGSFVVASAAPGGFGAGAGGRSELEQSGLNPVFRFHGAGGGGALGGAIFVREGGTLTIKNGAITAGTATAGAGGAGINGGSSGANGQAAGTSLYLMSTVDALFDIDLGDTVTLGGTIAGDGALTKVGTGTLVLSGANTYTGGTTINGGTIRVENNAALGTGDFVVQGSTLDLANGITFSNNITLENNLTIHKSTNGLSASITGSISESGGSFGLTKTGIGRINIAGVNSFSGPVSVQQGALIAFSDSALGSATSLFIASGATFGVEGADISLTQLSGAGDLSMFAVGSIELDVAAGQTSTFSGRLLGIGEFLLGGPGTVVLSGNSSNSFFGEIILDAGTLIVGHDGSLGQSAPVVNGGSLAAQGNRTLANDFTLNSTLNILGDDDLTLAGELGGAGGLTKNGGGTLNLTGNSSYAGTTTVNAGRLTVNGQIGSAIIVNGGGELGGSGAVGSATIHSGGTVAPGNSIGTLTVDGDYTQDPGSTYEVELNAAGQSDLIDVQGTATISGAAVHVLADPGAYASGMSFTILTATGGVTGVYSTLTSTGLGNFVRPTLVYGVNDVRITLASVLSQTAGLSNNETQVALILDQLFGNTTPGSDIQLILDQLNTLTPEQLQQCLDELTGSIAGSSTATSFQHAQNWLAALAAHLQPLGADGGAGGLVRSGMRGQRGLPGVTVQPEIQLASFDSRDGVSFQFVDCRQRSPIFGWIGGYGGGGQVTAGAAPAFDYGIGGTVFGVDTFIDDCTLLGLAGGYSNARTGTVDGSRVIDDTFSTAIYGSRMFESYYVLGAAGYTHHEYDSARQLAVLGRVADGNYDGNEFDSYVEGGLITAVGCVSVQPFVGLQYIHHDRTGYTETGAGAAGLIVSGAGDDSLRGSVGGRVVRPIELGNGMLLLPNAHARYVREFLDDNFLVTAALAGAPANTFVVQGTSLGRDQGIFGVGGSAMVSQNVSLHANYDFSLTSRQTGHTGSAGLMFAW